ncbi:MAG: outer membrane beta-barrel protein [Burkholderiaceae bacterium]|jgi:OOP family OmpA-OmpF porin
MTSRLRALTHGAIAMAALGLAFGACAQTSQSSLAKEVDASSSTTGKSFIDLSIGKSAYRTSCGNVAGLTCSRGTTSYSLTGGNMLTENLGVELTAMNLGKADRAGGSVVARGINLSAVGRVPLGDSVAIEAKVGPTYGITHVSAAQGAGLARGRDSGFGLGYGVAMDLNLVRGLHGSIGWEQHDFHFVGQGKSAVRNVTLALGYSF